MMREVFYNFFNDDNKIIEKNDGLCLIMIDFNTVMILLK